MNNDENVFIWFIQAMHFNASMIAGWWYFHNEIYPLAYFAKAGADIATQLPVYAMNVMAFGAMVHMITVPVRRLITETIAAIVKLASKSNVR